MAQEAIACQDIFLCTLFWQSANSLLQKSILGRLFKNSEMRGSEKSQDAQSCPTGA